MEIDVEKEFVKQAFGKEVFEKQFLQKFETSPVTNKNFLGMIKLYLNTCFEKII